MKVLCYVHETIHERIWCKNCDVESCFEFEDIHKQFCKRHRSPNSIFNFRWYEKGIGLLQRNWEVSNLFKRLRMKVLFLDIDGVLNCHNTPQSSAGWIGIDPEMLSQLKKIIVDTGVEIVLSSSWRIPENWREELKLAGCPIPILDRTPFHKGLTSRGSEIKAWLDEHPGVTKFACLDDNTDFHKDQKLFLTKFYGKGLTSEIRDEVIKYFNEE